MKVLGLTYIYYVSGHLKKESTPALELYSREIIWELLNGKTHNQDPFSINKFFHWSSSLASTNSQTALGREANI